MLLFKLPNAHPRPMEVTVSDTTAHAASGGRGLWRWSVALVATVAMIVAGSGLVAFAQSGAGTSKGPQFVPADASVYIEARFDMPDGQAEALAQFMTAFPGFADASSFGLKAEEFIDGQIVEATGGAVTSVDELAAFLTGEVGLALMDLAGAVTGGGDLPVLLGAAITDRVAAEAFATALFGGLDGEPLSETYGSASIMSVEGTVVGITDEWLLLAPTVELVTAAIDASDGTAPSLAQEDTFSSAYARVPAGHIAAVYMDLQSFGSLVDLAGLTAAGQTGVDLPIEDLLAQLPIDMVAYLAAESDRMTLEAFITPAEETPTIPVGDSELASLFPADSQLYIETRELGSTLETALAGLFETMGEDTAAELAPFEDMLGAPLPSFLDFISDASVGAGLSSDGLWLGIAAEVSDEELAAMRVQSILTIVRLFSTGLADDTETGISVATETIGETEVTVITLPIGDIAADAGLPFDIGQTISVAVDGATLLIGSGDFVETALTQSPEDSLGLSAGYTDALGADTSNSGVAYINIGSLLSVLDPLLGQLVPEWADIQPYATALDRFIAVGTADDEVISARMSIIVSQ